MRIPCIDWHAAFEALAFDHYRPYLYQAGYDLVRVYTEDDRIVFLAVTSEDGIEIDTGIRIADHLAEGITAATRGLGVSLGIARNGSAARVVWFKSPSDVVPLLENLPPLDKTDAVTPARPRSGPPTAYERLGSNTALEYMFEEAGKQQAQARGEAASTPTPAEGSPALAASPEAKAEEDVTDRRIAFLAAAERVNSGDHTDFWPYPYSIHAGPDYVELDMPYRLNGNLRRSIAIDIASALRTHDPKHRRDLRTVRFLWPDSNEVGDVENVVPFPVVVDTPDEGYEFDELDFPDDVDPLDEDGEAQ